MRGWEWVLVALGAVVVFVIVLNASSVVRYMKIKNM
jgi:hypothetical protein